MHLYRTHNCSELDDNNIGFFIITQKYSIGKNIEKLYFSGEKNDECKILSFHHTYYNNEYILSNIMLNERLILG